LVRVAESGTDYVQYDIFVDMDETYIKQNPASSHLVLYKT